MHDKDFQKNIETRLDIWDHLATVFLYSYTLELCVYYAWKRTSKILKSIYVYILNILRLHRIKISTWFISFDQDFHEYYENAHILLIIIHIISVGLLFTLAFFFHHTTTDRKDEQDQAPNQRIGNVPQFPIGIDVAVAEVGTTNRLGFQILMYQTYVSLWIIIMAKKCKFIQKPF